MKKLLLTGILLGICLLSFSQAKIYHKFPTANAAWSETADNYIPEQGDESCSHYQNVITGDTVVGSFTYHKLRSSGIYYDYGHCDEPAQYYTPSYFNNYLGAYREDTINKEVFFLQPNKAKDTLLYDFNLKLGDTLPLSYTNNETVNTIALVDSVLVGNKYHKRFGITSPNWGAGISPNYVYLIEGIGSTFGLLGSLHPLAEVPDATTLECFMQNGATVYPDTNTTCLMVSIKENEMPDMEKSKVYPDPFNNNTEISFYRTYENATVEIYDILGKPIEQFEYFNCKKISFDRGNLNSGLYFLKITFDKKSYEIKKIIISD
jgi:hypothetical protein